MISVGRVKEIRRLLAQSKRLAFSAWINEMSEKTARRYRDDDRLTSQRKMPRGDRSTGSPQRDYRDQCSRLPSRNCQEVKRFPCNNLVTIMTSLFTGNSNRRFGTFLIYAEHSSVFRWGWRCSWRWCGE